MSKSKIEMETIFIEWCESIGEPAGLGIPPFEAFNAGYEAAQKPPNKSLKSDTKKRCAYCRSEEVKYSHCRNCGFDFRAV